MEEVLPQKVIDRYGRWVETSINGWYVHLEASLDAKVVSMLERRLPSGDPARRFGVLLRRTGDDHR